MKNKMIFIFTAVASLTRKGKKMGARETKCKVSENENALYTGDKDVIGFLLDKKLLDPNAQNYKRGPPLYWSCFKGDEPIARLLIEKGALVDMPDSEKKTPLYVACLKGHESIARLLIEKGALADTPDSEGKIPLFVACLNGHESVARFLIEKGATVNSPDKHGDTPLYAACYNGHEPVARLLIKEGAVVDMPDKYGKTALYVACLNGHKSIARLLIENGATLSLEMATKYSYLIPYYEAREKLCQLILIRKYNANSLVGEDYLPRDLFGLICKEFVRAQKLEPYQEFTE